MDKSVPKGLVVDLSNVLRDASLDGKDQLSRDASWDRWDRLAAEWVRRIGPLPSVFMVADRSLEPRLDRRGSARLRSLMANGSAVVVPDADPVVIAAAVERQWGVLSRDRFDEHMKQQGAESVSYFIWRASSDGAISIEAKAREVPLSDAMTRKRDEKERGRLGLRSRSPELRFQWFCANDACSRHLVIWPDVRREPARCPDCASELAQGRLWKCPAYEVKVLIRTDSAEEVTTQRIPLEAGEQIILGREGLPGVIALQGVPATDLQRLSRRHLLMENDAGRVLVTDISSSGSQLIRPRGTMRRWNPPEPIPRNRPLHLTAGQRVKLAGRNVFIELSGRQIGVSE